MASWMRAQTLSAVMWPARRQASTGSSHAPGSLEPFSHNCSTVCISPGRFWLRRNS